MVNLYGLIQRFPRETLDNPSSPQYRLLEKTCCDRGVRILWESNLRFSSVSLVLKRLLNFETLLHKPPLLGTSAIPALRLAKNSFSFSVTRSHGGFSKPRQSRSDPSRLETPGASGRRRSGGRLGGSTMAGVSCPAKACQSLSLVDTVQFAAMAVAQPVLGSRKAAT